MLNKTKKEPKPDAEYMRNPLIISAFLCSPKKIMTNFRMYCVATVPFSPMYKATAFDCILCKDGWFEMHKGYIPIGTG